MSSNSPCLTGSQSRWVRDSTSRSRSHPVRRESSPSPIRQAGRVEVFRRRGDSRSCRYRSRRGQLPRSHGPLAVLGVPPVCCSACRTRPLEGMWLNTSCPQTGHQRNSNSASLWRSMTSGSFVDLARVIRATLPAPEKRDRWTSCGFSVLQRRRSSNELRSHSRGSRTSAVRSPRQLPSHRRERRHSGTQGSSAWGWSVSKSVPKDCRLLRLEAT